MDMDKLQKDVNHQRIDYETMKYKEPLPSNDMVINLVCAPSVFLSAKINLLQFTLV